MTTDALYYDCYRIRSPEAFPLDDLGPKTDGHWLLWSRTSPMRALPAAAKIALVSRWNQAACARHGHDWKAEILGLDDGPLFCGHCPARSFGRPGRTATVGAFGQGMVRPSCARGQTSEDQRTL